MAPSIGLEPTTDRFGGDSSIQVRYEGNYIHYYIK